MFPAPAQGAMVVVAMEHDAYFKEALASLNNQEATVCTHIERQFLKTLEGGCTAPIGGLATFEKDKIHLDIHWELNYGFLPYRVNYLNFFNTSVKKDFYGSIFENVFFTSDMQKASFKVYF